MASRSSEIKILFVFSICLFLLSISENTRWKIVFVQVLDMKVTYPELYLLPIKLEASSSLSILN
jgi:hypothetical protein